MARSFKKCWHEPSRVPAGALESLLSEGRLGESVEDVLLDVARACRRAVAREDLTVAADEKLGLQRERSTCAVSASRTERKRAVGLRSST